MNIFSTRARYLKISTVTKVSNSTGRDTPHSLSWMFPSDHYGITIQRETNMLANSQDNIKGG